MLHFGYNNPRFTYTIDNLCIPDSDDKAVKDLGILLCENLNFSQHISKMVKNAFHRMSLIFRHFKSRDIRLLTMAYKTYVRPMLEYATCIWTPYTKQNIKNVEKVQRYFTKRALGYPPRVSYEERLEILHLETLENRRLQYDLLLVYKMFHGQVELSINDFFTVAHTQTRFINSFKLVPGVSRLNVRKNFFSNRIVNIWNKLPENVVKASSDHRFRIELDKIDFQKV